MTATNPAQLRRYRRRVVALGGAAFLVIFALGAAIAIPRVQNDLENRVEDALAARDIEGVSVSFSGQDGTLECEEPLDDLDRAVRISNDVGGVRTIDVDATCLDDSTAEAGVTTTTTAPTPTPVATEAATSAPSTVAGDPDDLASIVQVLAGDPLFDQLWDLVEDTELDGDDLLGAPGPITLFAPTDDAFDDAFDTLGADAFGAMTADRELVRSLLRQHIAEGVHSSDTFGDGPIEMLDGSTLVIDPDIPTFSSAGSTVGVADPDTQLDIRASNGIVHAVDGILLPAEFPLPSDADPGAGDASAAASSTTEIDDTDGRVVLTGAVSSDEQRGQLRAAAETNVHPENVIDELDVVEDGPTAAEIDTVAVAVEAMVGSFVSGQVLLDDGEVSLVGVPLDLDGRVAAEEAAASAGFAVDLSARPIADEATAMALQEELNEFVRANPIQFEPESLVLTPASVPIVDQAAALARRLEGTDIVVVGFTDTAGSAESNQLFSLGRAGVVRDMFVERRFSADSVTAVGFGESFPILRSDGTEDEVASRRIEFGVTSR